jgi:hypothetical protein
MTACRAAIKQANYVNRKLEGKTKSMSNNCVPKSLIVSPNSTVSPPNSTSSSQNSINSSQNIIKSSQLPPLIADNN